MILDKKDYKLEYLKKHDIPFIWGRASYEETIELNKKIIINNNFK